MNLSEISLSKRNEYSLVVKFTNEDGGDSFEYEKRKFYFHKSVDGIALPVSTEEALEFFAAQEKYEILDIREIENEKLDDSSHVYSAFEAYVRFQKL